MWIIDKKDRILYADGSAEVECEYDIIEITEILKQVKSDDWFIDICLQETWTGKKYIWTIIKQKDLNAAVAEAARWDYQTLLIDSAGEFVLLDHHHDGTNKHTIRKMLKRLDDFDIDEMKEFAIGAEKGKFLDSVTEKLGPTVEDVATAWEG